MRDIVRRQLSGEAAPWWESRLFQLFAVFLVALPLLWPTIPPLVDYPGHLGRYRVELGIGSSPFLQRYYDFDWALIGNLGLDLLIIPMSAVFGLELGGKLLVIAIPVLTATGIFAIAREIHGRPTPYLLFALPLAYGYPFQFGFVNSCLSVAFALNAFALWLRLGRLEKYRLRATLFVPISCLVWVTHTTGWGVLGLACGAAELMAPHRRGIPYRRRLFGAVAACLPLTPPIALMAIWRSGNVGGKTLDMFNWELKWRWMHSVLREQDRTWDILGFAVICVAVVAGWLRGLRGIEARLALGAIVLGIAFVSMPRVVLGSAYADMRLVPVVGIFLLLAIRPLPSARWANLIALAGLGFLAARIAVTTIVYVRYDTAHTRQLAALDKVPRGARILVLVGKPCGAGWYSTRLEHIGSMAIVRRDAFVNDQWVMPGAQLLTVRYQVASPYMRDASQMVPTVPKCRSEPQRPATYTLRHFPRDAFDYVWLMNLPRKYWPIDPGLRQVYRNPNGALYRIVDKGR